MEIRLTLGQWSFNRSSNPDQKEMKVFVDILDICATPTHATPASNLHQSQ